MSENKYITAEGRFTCKVKNPPNGWLDETKAGTPFIRIPCIVSDEESDQNGREIVWRGYLSEKAKPYTVETLINVFDWDGDWREMDYFAGLTVSVVTEEEEYNGEPRIKVKWLNNTSNKKSKEKSDFLADRLNAEDKGNPAPKDTAKEKKTAAASKAMSSEAKANEQELEDDDIPF